MHLLTSGILINYLSRWLGHSSIQTTLIYLELVPDPTERMRLQSLAAEFKAVGHSWGVTHNLAYVPLFVDSRATRLIQYADLVAYAMWRK